MGLGGAVGYSVVPAVSPVLLSFPCSVALKLDAPTALVSLQSAHLQVPLERSHGHYRVHWPFSH